MANRGERAKIAEETAAITTRGTYVAPLGRTVDLAAAVRRAIDSSALFTPAEAAALPDRARQAMASRSFDTQFDVRNETTFAADKPAAEKLLAVGLSPRDKDLPVENLAAYTMVCNLILNLDETMTKE